MIKNSFIARMKNSIKFPENKNAENEDYGIVKNEKKRKIGE
jgi:hypothetical protein